MSNFKSNGLEMLAITEAEKLYRKTHDVRYLVLSAAKPRSSFQVETVEVPRWIIKECISYFENVQAVRPNKRSTIKHAISEALEQHPSSRHIEVLKKQRDMQIEEIDRFIQEAHRSEDSSRRSWYSVTFADACRELGIDDENSASNDTEKLYKQSKRNDPWQNHDDSETDANNAEKSVKAEHRNKLWETENDLVERARSRLDKTTS